MNGEKDRKEEYRAAVEDEVMRDELLKAGMDKESMEKLSDVYRSMKLPEELREKVVSAMEEGRRTPEGAEEAFDKKQIKTKRADRKETRTGGRYMAAKILTRTGQTAAAALIAITVLANSGAGVAYAMEKIPVIGAITKVVTFRTYEKQEGGTQARIEVPKVEAESGSNMSGAAEKVNKSVEEYTDRIIAQFEEDVNAGGKTLHKGVFTDYQVVTDSGRLFTLRLNTTEIMGSAAESVKLYNIDKEADKILTLKDMFPAGTDYVNILSEAVKQQMRENRNADESKVYFLDDGLDSDFKAIKEDQNFYVNGAGHMVLVFDEYEVAPGYMGVVEIEIPENIYKFQ